MIVMDRDILLVQGYLHFPRVQKERKKFI